MNPNQNSNKKRVTFASSEMIKKMMDPAIRNSLVSGFGARSSLATNLPGQHNSIGSRPSAAATGSLGGRQSIYNAGGEVAKRIPLLVKPSLKDNRKLTDVNVITSMCNKIFDFLSRNEASFQYTEKSLRKPTGKTEFKNIFEFLFRRIDDNYVLKGTALDDEVPKLLLALGYPYPLKSHHLQPLGATHSWPVVLGALVWLIDVIEAENNHDRESVKDELAYSYVFSCFKKKVQMEKLPKSQQKPVEFTEELNVFRELQLKEQNIEEDYRDLVQRRTENESAIAQIKQKIEEDKEEIENLETDVADFEIDISKLKDYNENVHVSITRIEGNIVEDEAGILKLLESLDEIENRNDKKEQLIQSQTMTGDEARSLILKRGTLKERLSSARTALNRAETKFYELQAIFFKESGKIDAEYHTFLCCLQDFYRSLDAMNTSGEVDWSCYQYDLKSDQFINDSRRDLTKLMDSLRERVAETIDKFRQSHAQLDIQLEDAKREIRLLEDKKIQNGLENNMRIQQRSRENNDKARTLQAHKKELELVRSQHNKVSGELNEQNLSNDKLHDKYLETQDVFMNKRNTLEKSYGDILSTILEEAGKLFMKFQALMKRKLELKQLGEEMLCKNQRELKELRKRNGTEG